MKRSAVYPGSFDPITNGHIYITERAAAIFDEVRVSVLVNVQKIATFSVEERCAMAREALSHLPNVTVGFLRACLWITCGRLSRASSSADCAPCRISSTSSRWL